MVALGENPHFHLPPALGGVHACAVGRELDITGRFKPDFIIAHLFGRAPSVAFLELVPRPAAAAPELPCDLVIEVGAARVRVPPGFDPTLLAAVVRALTEGAR